MSAARTAAAHGHRTETQILFGAEKELGPDTVRLDPLEMDRYSSIRQLRGLCRNRLLDLIDLRQTLADRIRDTETLLCAAVRIKYGTAEGLMKTRIDSVRLMGVRVYAVSCANQHELEQKAKF